MLVSGPRSHGKPQGEPEESPPKSSLESSRDPCTSAQTSARERALRIGEWLMLATGIVLFVVLFARLGVDNVLANLRTIGWGIVLIIASEILAFIANTIGWRAAFPRESRIPPFGQLLRARIAGDAINYLTPTANLGGEFVRVRMLERQAPVASLVASVMVAKLTQIVGLAVFVAIGLLFVADEARFPAGTRWGLFAGLTLFATLLAVLLLIQRRGFLSPALRVADRWRVLRFLAPLRTTLEKIDVEMTRAHRESTARILFSSGCFALGWAGGIIETYLILWFFGVPVSLKLVVAIEVLGVVLNNLMFFVPLRAGTQEAGKVLVFALLGLSPAQGMAAGVIYRIRELTWAFIGLALLARSRLQSRPLDSEVSLPLHNSPSRIDVQSGGSLE